MNRKKYNKTPPTPIRFWHGLINVVLSSGVHVESKEGIGPERQAWSNKRKQEREAGTIEEVKGLPLDPMKKGRKTVPMRPLLLQRGKFILSSQAWHAVMQLWRKSFRRVQKRGEMLLKGKVPSLCGHRT